ncbi:MAG: phosphatase PAP2 family protein [Clostridia bacterium]|nr:phosphatase PAP2 family protein [Clostridia bacterium]
MAVSKCENKHFFNYLATYLFACVIGMIMLIFIPTQMDRVAEGLYNDNPQGFTNKLLQFWYSLDGTKMAYNLFPSFHCLNSTVSYLGVRKRKEIPLWYRIYSFVMMITVFLATLFVKQHYFLDIIGGAGVAIICYVVCMKYNLGRIFNKPIEFFKKLFTKKK